MVAEQIVFLRKQLSNRSSESATITNTTVSVAASSVSADVSASAKLQVEKSLACEHNETFHVEEQEQVRIILH